MNVVIVEPKDRENIAAVVRHAVANPFDHSELEGDVERTPATDDTMRPFTVQIGGSLQITFTHEIQRAGLFRHISVSVRTPGKVPTLHAVSWLMGLFGMKPADFTAPEDPPDPTRVAALWLEEFQPGHKAVNVVQLIERTEMH